MGTLRTKSGEGDEGPPTPMPLRWAVIGIIAGAAGIGTGVATGWPAGIAAGSGVAAALHVIIGN